MPKVSVILFSYNHEKYLREAIESALNQTFQDFELIIWDDASTDRSWDIIKSYTDPRIRAFRSERNTRGACGLKTTSETAIGEYIAIHHSDDVWEADKLRKQVEILDTRQNLGAVFTWVSIIDNAGTIFERHPVQNIFQQKNRTRHEWLRYFLSGQNALCHPSTLIRKICYRDCGPYRIDIPQLDDLDMWVRLCLRHEIHVIPEPLVRFRWHDSNTSRPNPLSLNQNAFAKYLVYENYAKIDTLDDVLKILPEAAKYRGATDSDAAYMLARTLADITPFGALRLFAQQQLSRLVSDPARAARIEELHGFNVMDFKEITGHGVIFAQGQANAPAVAPAPIPVRRLDDRRIEKSGKFEKPTPLPDASMTPSGDTPFDSIDPETLAAYRYYRWQETRKLDAMGVAIFQEHAQKLWKKRYLFEFCFVLKSGAESLLADSIDAVAQQYYDGWRLTIFAQTPSPDKEFTREGNPARWMQIPEGVAPEDFINEHLLQSTAHWVGFFECGMRFAPQLTLLLSDYLSIHPEWRAIYTDDDMLGEDGGRCSPAFKPDFNLELLRSADYMGCLFVDRAMLLAAGGYAKIPDAAHFDIALRVSDACGDLAIGHIPDVLLHLPPAASPRAADGGAAQALREHLARRGIAGEVFQGLVEGATRRVVYQHPGTPKVSIIVPTKNRLDLIRPCVESLLQQTRYPEWELLLVDNGSDDQEVIAYYMSLRERHAGKIRLLSFDAPFNYSTMNNRASLEARGDYLLLLNNDTECIHDDWLDAMMAHAQRPDVGIVGARLLFPDSLKVQHAGVVLGIEGTSSHVYCKSLAHDEPGYLGRAQADQEYSAVTGACLLIRKSLFDELGGLDEEAFRISFNDIDLCLKVRKRGLRIIWTPFATLLHRTAATRKADSKNPAALKKFKKESSDFYFRWRRELTDDPAWNRNLSLSHSDPTIEEELAVPWQREFHDRPRVVATASTSHASEEYRYLGALRALHAENRLSYVSVCRPFKGYERAPSLVELDRMDPDVLLMHSAFDNTRCSALLFYRLYRPELLRIFSLDDLITNLPSTHPNYDKLPADVIMERLELALKASHRLIVSTEPLAEVCRHLIDDIRVIPNALDGKRWEGLESRRRQGKKLRVGWAGAGQHGADLRFLRDILEATHTEVDWIFFGMLIDELKPFVAESHAYVRFSKYPEKLASLDLDLGVVPLEMNPFNEAKSNLRLLEYGMLGWPVICTDIYPYQTNNPPVTRLPNDTARWIAAIRERIADPDALAREGDALRDWVKRHYLLENHLDQWRSALLP